MNKILNILINEDPASMKLGINTTLLYALFCATEIDLEVNFIRLDENPDFPNQIQNIYKIDKNFAQLLFKNYQDANQQIRHSAYFLEKYDAPNLGEVLKQNEIENFILKIKDSDFIKKALKGVLLNRIEPMKPPFPPHGKNDINQFLKNLIAHFSNVHAPINLSDKEFISDLSAPTIEIKTQNLIDFDKNIVAKAIKNSIDQYHQLYPHHSNSKIVLKPKDSAQSLGVLALEFVKNGEINSVVQINPNQQIYKIDSGVLFDNDLLTNIIKKSLEAQIVFGNNIVDLYGDTILAQPYLAGVEIGDFRAIIVKNNHDKFEYFGSVFRKKLQNSSISKNFTTCATSGQSLPSQLGKYQKIIDEFAQKIVRYLNNHERKYQSVHFVGADIIAKDESVSELFLGEMNMHCPALISMVGENLTQVVEKIIRPQIKMILEKQIRL